MSAFLIAITFVVVWVVAMTWIEYRHRLRERALFQQWSEVGNAAKPNTRKEVNGDAPLETGTPVR
jgi:hypothetical protein